MEKELRIEEQMQSSEAGRSRHFQRKNEHHINGRQGGDEQNSRGAKKWAGKFVPTWIYLEDMMLSEISWTWKDVRLHCLIYV